MEKKNTITKDHVMGIMDQSIIAVETVFNKCTIVAVQLPNGFVIVESSACVDPANYDEKLGADIALKKVADKIWELEGYALQKRLAEEPSKPQIEIAHSIPTGLRN